MTLTIPDTFWSVPYVGSRYPGAIGVRGVEDGANCQQFAYELLRHNGFVISNMRSSELWTDELDTVVVDGELVAGDLLLFNKTPEAWGAHVAVYLESGRAIHLAQHIGKPTIWTMGQFIQHELYSHFIGAKRCTGKIASSS